MVIDSSAIVAVLMNETERHRFNALIASAPRRMISAAGLVEAAIVIESRYGESGGRELDLYLHRAGIEVTPVDADQAELARAAWRRFGKGRHPASLNYGDCFSYALSIWSGEPLLYKGNDFTLTDIVSADKRG